MTKKNCSVQKETMRNCHCHNLYPNRVGNCKFVICLHPSWTILVHLFVHIELDRI